ncbi:outer membrane protein [Aminobacter sp. HY435]|uniref:outer membrane protein n=1 Tax=Aminobacter sp. HY435 TaxID=2970917 RepID=UPI0022B9727D|nr:outer membrane protein [Aminobacter sp. HY435]
MKILLSALILSLALAGRATAADAALPAAAPHDWTGAYVGGVIGYGWGTTQARDNLGAPSSDIDYDGFLGGLAIGYNKQFGDLVVGAEADIAYAGLSGSGNGGIWGCGPPDIDTCAFDVRALGTVRARLGYAFDNVLPYLTGGLAVGRVEGELVGVCVTGNWCGSDTKAGWTAGAGLELALDEKWSAKVEYLYVDLGTGHFAQGSGGEGFRADFRFHALRLGLNYRF